MERGRDEDGLHKCSSVLLWCSHHLPSQEGACSNGTPTAAGGKQPLFRPSLSERKAGGRADGNVLGPWCRSRFASQICEGAGTRRQDAGLARTPPANRQQTPTPACNPAQAELNKHENPKIITAV